MQRVSALPIYPQCVSLQRTERKTMREHLEKKDSGIDMERFGRRLKEACARKKVTPLKLQRVLGLGSVQAVYLWLAGKRLPSLDNLYAISKFLGVRMEELLEEKAEQGDAPEAPYLTEAVCRTEAVCQSETPYRAEAPEAAHRPGASLLSETAHMPDHEKRMLYYWEHLR